MQGKAFWIKGKKLQELGLISHIDWIIKYPEHFGLTKEKIYDMYKKHDEKIGLEGKAREELIKMVSKSGWVRVRHYVHPKDYWSIQVNRFIPSRERTISNFLHWAIYEKNVMRKDAPLVIVGYEDKFVKEYAWKNGGAQKFLEESIVSEKNVMTQIEWIKMKNLLSEILA